VGISKAQVGVLALVACGLPEVDLEGAHVRLAIESGLTPCGDATGHMDRFVTVVAAELGVTPPTGDDRYTYHWLRPGDFAGRNLCSEDAAGCAWPGGDIYSATFPLDHELVHTIANTYGLIPPFFSEGLATVYELPIPGYSEDQRPLGNIAIADAIEAREPAFFFASEHYTLAGGFVAFLIERNGVPALRRALAQMRWSDRPGRISDILAIEVGASLEQLSAEFDATRRNCTAGGYRRKLYECSAPEIAWDGALWAGHRTLDCDQDDVVGPFLSDVAAHYRTIEVPVEARYALSVVADALPGSLEAASEVTLLRCGGCDEYLELTLSGDAPTVTRTLPAGRYSLRFTAPAAAAAGVGLRIARVEEP
jgi:hypothetical protein